MPDIFDTIEEEAVPQGDVFDSITQEPQRESKEELRRQQQAAAREGFWSELGGDVADFLTGGATALTFSPSAIVGQVERGTGLNLGLEETIRRPIVTIPEIPTTAETPTAGAVAAGAANAVVELANFFLSPEGISMFGIKALPKAAQQAVASAWAGQMFGTAPDKAEAALEAAKAGDVAGATKAALSGLIQVGAAGAIGRHAAGMPAIPKMPTGPDILTPEQAAANRAAVNLAAPGTRRPGEVQRLGPLSDVAPPEGMIVGEIPEPMKFTRVAERGLQAPEFLEPSAPPAAEAPLPFLERETRGKVSFGAPAEAGAVPNARQQAISQHFGRGVQPPYIVDRVAEIVESGDRLGLAEVRKFIESEAGAGVIRATRNDLLRLVDSRLEEIESGKPNAELEALRSILRGDKPEVSSAVVPSQRRGPTVEVAPEERGLPAPPEPRALLTDRAAEAMIVEAEPVLPRAAAAAKGETGAVSAEETMTIHRAASEGESGIREFSSWTQQRESAEKYMDNPGFGGPILRSETVPKGKILEADVRSVRGMMDLAEKLGFDRDKGQEWFENGWQYPWEESGKVREALKNSGYDWIEYVDDFPQGSKTILALKNIPSKKGTQNASQITEATAVHGNVRPLEKPAQGMPEPRGGARVQPQAAGGLPRQAQPQVLLTDPKTGLSADAALSMSGEQFLSAVGNDLTGTAYRLGAQARTPEQIAKLKELRARAVADAEKAIEQAKEAAQSGNLEIFSSPDFMAATTRPQFFTEALESAVMDPAQKSKMTAAQINSLIEAGQPRRQAAAPPPPDLMDAPGFQPPRPPRPVKGEPFSEYERKMEEYDSAYDDWMKTIPSNQGLIFDSGGVIYTVTKDPGGKWRTTSWSKKDRMPIGHELFENRELAIRSMRHNRRIEAVPFQVEPLPPKLGSAIPSPAESVKMEPLQPQVVGVPARQVPASEIALRPDLMQFKRIDEAQSGINLAEKLEGTWDDLKAGTVLLWEPKNPAEFGLEPGQKYIVANGHHRVEFGTRQKVKGYNAQVLREADGYSASDARRIGAEINIADNKGSIHDQVKFIRNTIETLGKDEALAAARRIGAKGRKAANIAINASDSLFDAFVNERVTPEQAEGIALAAPGNEAAQRFGIRYAIQGKSPAFVQNLLRGEVARQAEASQGAMTQGGFWDNVQDAAIEQMEARAERATAFQQEIIESIRAVQNAARNPKTAAKFGVNVKDPQGVQRKVEQLKAELERWESWPNHPDLKAKVYGEAAPEERPPAPPAPPAPPPEAPKPAPEPFKPKVVLPKHGPKVDGFLADLKSNASGTYSPTKTKLYQDLGKELIPGIRLGDAETAGRLYEMVNDGAATPAEWVKWVEEAKASGRVAAPEAEKAKSLTADLFGAEEMPFNLTGEVQKAPGGTAGKAPAAPEGLPGMEGPPKAAEAPAPREAPKRPLSEAEAEELSDLVRKHRRWRDFSGSPEKRPSPLSAEESARYTELTARAGQGEMFSGQSLSKRINDALEGLKLGGEGELAGGLYGVSKALWNGSINAAQMAVRAGASVSDAVKAALEYIDKNFSGRWDRAKAEAFLKFRLSGGVAPRDMIYLDPEITSPATQGKSSALAKARNTLETYAKGKTVRDFITYAKDAGENAANLFANTQANDVRGALNRAMGRNPATGKQAREKTLDAEALTFVREADGDRAALGNFRAQIAASTAAKAKVKRQAIAAIDHAAANWDRLSPVADVFKRIMDAQVDAENANGIATLRRKGYVPHAQEMPNEFGLFETGAGTEGSGFMHARSFNTYAESIAAGVDPKSLDAIALLSRRVAAGHRMINLRAWTESLRTIEDPKTGNPLVADPITVERSDPNLPADVRMPNGYTAANVGSQHFGVLNGYAGVVGDLTNPSYLSRNVGLQALRQTAAVGKHVSLMMDTFHLGRMAFWEMIIKPLSFTDPKLPLPSYKRGLLTLDYTPAELQRMASAGEIDASKLPALMREREIVQGLVKEGYNVGSVVDQMYQDVLHALPGLKQTTAKFNKWLFQQFQRGAMAEIGVLEFQRRQRMFPEETAQQSARAVAHDLNIRFGNLGRQGWLRSRTGQDLARLIFLAPQWNEALIKSEVGALTGAAKGVVQSAKSGRLQFGILPRAVGAMILGQFAANQLINFATRGKPTWENEEEGFGAKVSAYIPDVISDGPGFFLHPAGLAAEITHLLTGKHEKTDSWRKSLIAFLGSRASQLTRPLIPYVLGRNAFGQLLREKDIGKETLKAAVPLPIPTAAITGAGRELVTGEPGEKFRGAFQKQIMASMGVKTDQAPGPAQRMYELARKFNLAAGQEPSAEFYGGDYTALTRALEIGNATDAAAELESLKKKRTRAQMLEHYARYQQSPFTGSSTRETKFRATLSPEQRATYQRAVQERRKIASRFGKLLNSGKLD